MGDGGPVYIHSSGGYPADPGGTRLWGHCYVGSEHLLLGLACQGTTSLAASLLREAGSGQPLAAGGRCTDGGTGVPGPHPCARA